MLVSFKFFCDILFFISSKLCADCLECVTSQAPNTHLIWWRSLRCMRIIYASQLKIRPLARLYSAFLYDDEIWFSVQALYAVLIYIDTMRSAFLVIPCRNLKVAEESFMFSGHQWLNSPHGTGKLMFIAYFKTYTSSPYHDVARVSSTLSENDWWSLRAHM